MRELSVNIETKRLAPLTTNGDYSKNMYISIMGYDCDIEVEANIEYEGEIFHIIDIHVSLNQFKHIMEDDVKLIVSKFIKEEGTNNSGILTNMFLELCNEST